MPRWRAGDVTLNGYLPHIIAFNTWQGEGAPPPPANALGIRYFEIVLPNETELARIVERITQSGMAIEQREPGILVRDPAQVGVVLTTRSKEG